MTKTKTKLRWDNALAIADLLRANIKALTTSSIPQTTLRTSATAKPTNPKERFSMCRRRRKAYPITYEAPTGASVKEPFEPVMAELSSGCYAQASHSSYHYASLPYGKSSPPQQSSASHPIASLPNASLSCQSSSLLQSSASHLMASLLGASQSLRPPPTQQLRAPSTIVALPATIV